MRRRVVRESVTLFGVVVIIAGVALFNGAMQRGDLKERSLKIRAELEEGRLKEGIDLLKWPVIQKTKGGFRSGPTFNEALRPYDGKQVDIIGFQVPLEEFRDMTTFLLLPMPIECYFCQSPPMRDVILVKMREGDLAPLVKEPVLINGTLKLNKGPKQQFFYTIADAGWEQGQKDGRMPARREVPIEHRLPHNQEGPLLEGEAPPTAADADLTLPASAAPAAPDAAASTPAAAPTPDAAAAPAPAEPAASAPADAAASPPAEAPAPSAGQ